MAVDYRLAPEHRFPPRLKMHAAWWTRLEQGVPVGVAGDSAGANLAAAAAQTHRKSAGMSGFDLSMIDAKCSSPSYATYANGYGLGAIDISGDGRNICRRNRPRDPLASPIYARDIAGLAPAFVHAECRPCEMRARLRHEI